MHRTHANCSWISLFKFYDTNFTIIGEKLNEVNKLQCNVMLSNRFNHSLLPASIRGVFDGRSGVGKETLLTKPLLHPMCPICIATDCNTRNFFWEKSVSTRISHPQESI